MRYVINFNKTINQLIPYYLGGRKLILYLQALMKPLQLLNDAFAEYAKETRIEVSMTSQIIMFEWYLNRKLSKYFLNDGSISVKNGERIGTPIYNESADVSMSDNMLLYMEQEKQSNLALYHSNESTDKNTFSFVVSSPAINTAYITTENYIAMLTYYIDKYRISGKSYKIKINS